MNDFIGWLETLENFQIIDGVYMVGITEVCDGNMVFTEDQQANNLYNEFLQVEKDLNEAVNFIKLESVFLPLWKVILKGYLDRCPLEVLQHIEQSTLTDNDLQACFDYILKGHPQFIGVIDWVESL